MKPVMIVLLTLTIIITTMMVIATIEVYEDEMVYLSVNQNPVMESGWLEFTFKSKVYTGDVNVILGVNSSDMSFSNPQIYNPQNTNGTQTNWSSLNNFNVMNKNFNGRNKWYYLTNKPIIVNQTYKIRVWATLKEKGEYTFAIYPSSYGTNIVNAYNNGHLYLLDSSYISHNRFTKDYINEQGLHTKDFKNSDEVVIETNKLVVGYKNRWGVKCYEN